MGTTAEKIVLVLVILLTAMLVYTNKKLGESIQTVESLEKDNTMLMAEIERDDAILNKFMGGGWDRSCGYALNPEELLADGTFLSGITKVCEGTN